MAVAKHKFRRKSPDSLITTPCRIGNDRFSFAIDTGASHTVIDLTPLLMVGYELGEAIEEVELETGKGPITAHLFQIESLTVFGITRRGFQVCVYDFLANSVLPEFDGILGLDFFTNETICIDFGLSEITVQTK